MQVPHAHMHMRVCANTFVHSSGYAYVYTHAPASMYILYTHVHISKHIHRHTCSHVHIVHIYTAYTYIHTDTPYTHTQNQQFATIAKLIKQKTHQRVVRFYRGSWDGLCLFTFFLIFLLTFFLFSSVSVRLFICLLFAHVLVCFLLSFAYVFIRLFDDLLLFFYSCA